MKNKKYLTNPPKTWMIIFWCLSCLSMCYILHFMTHNLWATSLFLIFIIIFTALYIFWYWNYPILEEKYLIIKNILFHARTYNYCDIERIDLVCINSKGYVIAIKLNGKHFRKSTYITCVATEQLNDLCVELTQKGLTVKRK